MRTLGTILTLILIPAVAGSARAAVEIETFAGSAWNLKVPVRISQEGSAELNFTGRFDTRAFDLPLYYAWRVAWTEADCGWALDFVHHKLYLEDRPPEVQRFSISHGFNILSVARFWNRGWGRLYIGLGIILAHAENEVRGRALDETGGIAGGGYYLTGPAATLGLGKRVFRCGRFHLAGELRGTAARARIPVVEGTARFNHFGLHAVSGVGFRL